MRYFIALRFTPDIRMQLASYQKECLHHGYEGKLTSPNNLHLTLLFLGQLSESMIKEISIALESVSSHRFHLVVDSLDVFKKKTKETLWAKPQESIELLELYETIVSQLLETSLRIQPTLFVPHITLLRSAENTQNVPLNVLSLPCIQLEINAFYLMKSWNDEGALTYSPMKEYSLLPNIEQNH